MFLLFGLEMSSVRRNLPRSHFSSMFPYYPPFTLFPVAMGSMGWAKCYWCEYWNYNPYIIDGVGEPFCDWCFDWFLDGGGPYRPHARDRCYQRLESLSKETRNWPADVIWNITEFAFDWIEP